MIKEKQTIESFRSFSWVTSKIRGSFVSELLRASLHSAAPGYEPGPCGGRERTAAAQVDV